MEISQIEQRLEDTQDEYEKAQKFKEYVQGIFIENNSQDEFKSCLLYTSPSPRDATLSRMPSSA